MEPTVAVVPQAGVTTNLNIDSKTLEQCVKSVSSFGQTVYTNICNGHVATVPWGSVDWAFAICVTVVAAACVLCLLAFAVGIWRDL